MKNFVKYDFYTQLSFLVIGLIMVFVGITILKNGVFFLFYFIVGIPQLISFLIKAFQNTKKSRSYFVYGFFIIPVWISWLIILGFNSNNDVINFFGYILLASAFYSPFLAILYIYDAYQLYQSQKKHDEHS